MANPLSNRFRLVHQRGIHTYIQTHARLYSGLQSAKFMILGLHLFHFHLDERK